MIFTASAGDEVVDQRTYYSVGGGFIVTSDAEGHQRIAPDDSPLTHPFHSGDDLLALCADTGKSIARLSLENELAWRLVVDEFFGGLDLTLPCSG